MKKYILFLLIIGFFYSAVGQSHNKNGKPKVALVLSGGTAKGLAHIGVLKLLEEEGIRPDIIVGTSMGSIIGGLYALGYSASQIEQITLNTDWFKYLSNNSDLRNINIDEKDAFEEFVYNFPIEKMKPSLGKGIIYGHELDLYLSRITFPAFQYSSFDDFPIKFRAIATDLIGSKSYIFKDGPLSLALRASMSIPTLFAPVEYDGKLLVDGGILNNFGVDIALQEHADIIIGSNVERIIKSSKDIDSYKNLISILMMLESKNKYAKYKDSVDVLIEAPVVEKGARFDEAQMIIDIGYQTAKLHLDELKEVKAKIKNFEVKNKSLDLSTDNDLTYNISQIAVRGIQDITDKYRIYNRLRESIGQKASVRSIEDEITDLYSSRQFDYIKYHIEKIVEDDYKLVFDFLPKAKNYLQLGMHYNEQVDLGIILGIISRNNILPNSKFKIKARVSKYPGVDQYFIKYLNNKSKIGLKQIFNFSVDNLPIYKGNSKLISYKRSYLQAGISGHKIINNNTAFEFGYRYQKMWLNSEFKSEFQGVKSATFDRNNLYLSLDKNTLDYRFFANNGYLFHSYINYYFSATVSQNNKVGFQSIFFPENYGDIGFKLDYYKKLNKRWVWENSINTQYTAYADENDLFVTKNSLGGVYTDNIQQNVFWGMPSNYLLSRSKLILRTSFRYKISDKVYVKPTANIAISDNYESHLGFGANISFNSPIGPLSFYITKSLDYNTPIIHVSMGYFR